MKIVGAQSQGENGSEGISLPNPKLLETLFPHSELHFPDLWEERP